MICGLFFDILFCKADKTGVQPLDQMLKLYCTWDVKSPSASMDPGEIRDFEVTALCDGTTVGIKISCLNCTADFTQITEQSDGSIKLRFDSAAYIKNNKKIGYPQDIAWYFIAQKDKLKSDQHGIKLTINGPGCDKKDKTNCESAYCTYIESTNKCIEKGDPNICTSLKSEPECKKSSICGWSKSQGCITNLNKAVEDKILADYPVPKGYQGPLPDCAFSGTCRDINDFIQLLVNYGTMAIGGIAGFAFVFFVYGGFVWIFSFGNSEKVQHGQQILVAAVVGMVIVFSAYILVGFLLEVLGVKGSFIGI